MVKADGVTLLGDNTDAIRRNPDTGADAMKEVGLQVKADETVHDAVMSPECTEQSRHKDS